MCVRWLILARARTADTRGATRSSKLCKSSVKSRRPRPKRSSQRRTRCVRFCFFVRTRGCVRLSEQGWGSVCALVSVSCFCAYGNESAYTRVLVNVAGGAGPGQGSQLGRLQGREPQGGRQQERQLFQALSLFWSQEDGKRMGEATGFGRGGGVGVDEGAEKKMPV